MLKLPWDYGRRTHTHPKKNEKFTIFFFPELPYYPLNNAPFFFTKGSLNLVAKYNSANQPSFYLHKILQSLMAPISGHCSRFGLLIVFKSGLAKCSPILLTFGRFS
jgi:hypothetical protein